MSVLTRVSNNALLGEKSSLPINSRVDITNVSDLYYANDNSVWLKTGTTISGAAASAFPQAARAAAVTTNDYSSAALLDDAFGVVGYTPVAMRAKPNGTSMFILGNDSVLREYRMQNGQIQSLEDTGITFSFVPFAGGKTPSSFCFDDPYGKKLFYMDEDGMVYQCTLGVAWDITTAVYDNVSSFLLMASQFQIQQPYDLNFNSTGTVLSVVKGSGWGEGFSLSCTTPWDLSTISYIGMGYFPSASTGGAFCWVLGETVALTNVNPSPFGLFTGTTVGTAGQLNTTQGQAFDRAESYLGPNSSLDASPDGTIVYMLRDSFVYQLNIPLNTIGDPTAAGNTYIRIA